MTAHWEYGLIGTVKVRRGKAVIELPGGAPLAVFAILLVNLGQIMSTEAIMDLLWGGHPPKTARVLVAQYVSALRQAFIDAGFPDPPVKRQEPGYVIRKQSGTLDITVFRELVLDAHGLARRQDWEAASAVLARARALRRDRPLVEINCPALTGAYVPLLEQEYLEATEDWISAELHLSRHRELLPELREIAVSHPHREQTHALLMRALHHDDQRAEALEVYERIQQALKRDLNLEPGTSLQEARRAIFT